MTKMWCINCQAERQHAYFYGQEPCCEGGNCEHRCHTCDMSTLAYIQPSSGHSEIEVIKQMVGEAQRKASANNLTGNVEVKRVSGSVEGSDYQTQILVYNTYTRHYHFSKS